MKTTATEYSSEELSAMTVSEKMSWGYYGSSSHKTESLFKIVKRLMKEIEGVFTGTLLQLREKEKEVRKEARLIFDSHIKEYNSKIHCLKDQLEIDLSKENGLFSNEKRALLWEIVSKTVEGDFERTEYYKKLSTLLK